MPSGQSAGFAKGLAGVLQSRTAERRKKESEQADRDFTLNLQAFLQGLKQGAETGDYSFSERIFETMNPEQAKQLKKQGGLGAVIGPIVQQAGLQEGAQAGGAVEVEVPGQDGTAGAGPLGPRAATGPAPAIPEGARTPGIIEQPEAAAGPEFLGIPYGLSPEQRRTQAQEATAAAQLAPWEAKMTFARRLVEQGAYETLEEALAAVGVGVAPPATPTRDFTLGTGQRRYDPEGKLIAEGREGAPRTTTGFTLSPGQVRYGPKGEEVARGPAKGAEEADSAAAARARMAARQPQILQGWTPSDQGEALALIEQDPELYLQYEGKRQEAARAMATTLQRSLGALLDTSGATPQLSRGAKMIYGLSKAELGEQASRFYTAEGKEATASIKQLVGQEVLDQIAAMKAQSPTGATGFGQMNMAELDLLIASATVLQNWGLTTSNIGEERALTELIAIQDQLARILEDSDVEVEQQQLLDEQQRRDAAGLTGVTMDKAGNIYRDGELVDLTR